jgi:hypothetical protein
LCSAVKATKERNMDLSSLTEYISGTKGILDIAKSVRDLLPSGPKREEFERELNRAEEALKRSDAKLAKDLGYNLCQCTFPPQPMLRRVQEKAFVCDACGYKKRYLDPSDYNTRARPGGHWSA